MRCGFSSGLDAPGRLRLCPAKHLARPVAALIRPRPGAQPDANPPAQHVGVPACRGREAAGAPPACVGAAPSRPPFAPGPAASPLLPRPLQTPRTANLKSSRARSPWRRRTCTAGTRPPFQSRGAAPAGDGGARFETATPQVERRAQLNGRVAQRWEHGPQRGGARCGAAGPAVRLRPADKRGALCPQTPCTHHLVAEAGAPGSCRTGSCRVMSLPLISFQIALTTLLRRQAPQAAAEQAAVGSCPFPSFPSKSHSPPCCGGRRPRQLPNRQLSGHVPSPHFLPNRTHHLVAEAGAPGSCRTGSCRVMSLALISFPLHSPPCCGGRRPRRARATG